jgi:hypothetical protein
VSLKPGLSWLAVTIPALLVGGFLLARTIASLVQATRGSVVATLPLSSDQAFELAAAGPYDLYLEGPRLALMPRGVGFSLSDAAGLTIPVTATLVPTKVTSFSRVRVRVARFAVAAPGSFTLRLTGPAVEAGNDFRVVLARPVTATLTFHVLALVALGILTIGSLVATVLLVVSLGSSEGP